MNVCMLAYTFYESDNRVMRYAETLAQRGHEVDVISLRYADQPRFETINNVNVFRIQSRVRNERTQWTHLFRLVTFLVYSMAVLTRKHIRRRYQLIHVHSVPDFLVFAAWLPRIMGCRLILDIHDLLPELYANKFKIQPGSLMYRLLIAEERISAAFAHRVIIPNHLWYERIIERSVEVGKGAVIMNAPDSSIFHPGRRERNDGKFIIIFPGSLNQHQGVDIAVRAVHLIRDRVPNLEFHVYGLGPERNSLVRLIADLGLQDRVLMKSPLPLRDIAQLMRESDVGVVPKRSDSFGNEAFSTKVLEFMASGVPVLVADTKIDRHYFNDSIVKFFRSGDPQDMARELVSLAEDQALRARLVREALAFVKQNDWQTTQETYLALVDGLVGRNAARAVALAAAP